MQQQQQQQTQQQPHFHSQSPSGHPQPYPPAPMAMRAHPRPHPNLHAHPAAPPPAHASLPKQQIATVLNAMTAHGRQQFHSMDAYDLANLHALNVRYLQQISSQRSLQLHPQRPPDMAPPSAALFAAKM